MVFNFVLFLASIFVNSYHAPQAEGGVLLMQLSGSEVDEGNYKQTAYLNFEKYDDKCKLRRDGTVKLNKKTRTATRPLVPGKPVMVFCYYSDHRTQYGRSVGQRITFYPKEGTDYIIAMDVEGGKVDFGVFEKAQDGSKGSEVAVLRGNVTIECDQAGGDAAGNLRTSVTHE